MNSFKTLAIAAFCLVSSTSFAQQVRLTQAQEKAQRSLYFYLDKEKYRPEVDASDNSVCFRVDGTLYWVTFSENNPVLYTLHRKGFKVGDAKDDYRRSAAIVAANEINQKYPGLKVTVSDTKVDLVMDAYANNPEDYNNVFRLSLDRFRNIDKDFKNAYEVALKNQKEEKAKMMNEIKDMVPPSALRGLITNTSFRVVDAAGNPLSQFDAPLRAFNTHFIQPRFEIAPWTADSKTVRLFIRIVRPDGNVITLPGKKYTGELTLDLEKSKKPATIDVLDYIGSEKPDFWKAGEYKFEVLDGLDVIYQTRFNLL